MFSGKATPAAAFLCGHWSMSTLRRSISMPDVPLNADKWEKKFLNQNWIQGLLAIEAKVSHNSVDGLFCSEFRPQISETGWLSQKLVEFPVSSGTKFIIPHKSAWIKRLERLRNFRENKDDNESSYSFFPRTFCKATFGIQIRPKMKISQLTCKSKKVEGRASNSTEIQFWFVKASSLSE